MNVYNGSNSSVQQVIPFNATNLYMRRYQVSNASWGSWYEYNGTEVN